MDDGQGMTSRDLGSDSPHKFKVLTGYRSAYPEPFVVQAGDVLIAGDRQSEWPGWIWCTNREGESRWMPGAYLRRQGEQCIALRDYDAAELTVRPGQELVATEESGGWFWCTDQDGQRGWVPAEHLICDPEAE